MLPINIELKESLIHKIQKSIINENCVINKGHLERDFILFRNIVEKIYGNRIVAIVVLMHLNNIEKFLNTYANSIKEGYKNTNDPIELNKCYSTSIYQPFYQYIKGIKFCNENK